MTLSFSNLINFILRVSPISSAINIIFAICMLILGIYLNKNNQHSSKEKKIGAIVCISFSVLSTLSAIINVFFIFTLSN